MNESNTATVAQANTQWEPWFDEYVEETAPLDTEPDDAPAPKTTRGSARFASALLVAGVLLTTVLYVAS